MNLIVEALVHPQLGPCVLGVMVVLMEQVENGACMGQDNNTRATSAPYKYTQFFVANIFNTILWPIQRKKVYLAYLFPNQDGPCY